MTDRYVIGRAKDQTESAGTYYVYDRERLAMLNHAGDAVSGHAPNVSFTLAQAQELVNRLNGTPAYR